MEKVAVVANEGLAKNLAKLVAPVGRKYTLREIHEGVKKLAKGAERERLQRMSVGYFILLAYPILKQKWLYVDVEKSEVSSPLFWKKRDAVRVLKEATLKVNSYSEEVQAKLRSVK